MQLGVLEYLISVNDKGVKEGINRSERTIKESANRTDRELKERENKLTAWTIAKGQMIANFTERALRSAGNLTKQLLKSAISSYADYEQLVGGIETLFGKSTDKMMMYANRAYMTAGISANKYMELATSFAASLLQSCGEDTEIAADLAERAITDMADNANKFGSDLESIQNAYKGFSKQNYTMLDNLKLGYGGTKSEMERLIKEASALTDIQKELNIEVKANDMSYANIVKAISVIQKSRGVMGTTAEEASRTISGSIGMLKASWQNMLTTMADPDGDLGTAMDKVSESAETVLHNLIPVFKQTLKSMTKLVKRALPEIGKLFKTDILPAIRDIGKSALQGIKNAFANGGRGILEFLMGDDYNDETTWSDFGKKVIGGIKKGIDTVKLSIATILGLTDENGNPVKIADDATWGDIGTTILDKISKGLEEGGWLTEALDKAAKNVGTIANFVGTIITELATWIGDNAPEISRLIVNIINAIAKSLPEIANAITDIITDPNFQSAITELVNSIGEAFKQILPGLVEAAKNIWDGSSTTTKVGIAAWLGYKGFKLANTVKDLFGGTAGGGLLKTVFQQMLPGLGTALKTAGASFLTSTLGTSMIGAIISVGGMSLFGKWAASHNAPEADYVQDPYRYSNYENKDTIQAGLRALVGKQGDAGWNLRWLAANMKPDDLISLFNYKDVALGETNWLWNEIGRARPGGKQIDAAIYQLLKTSAGYTIQNGEAQLNPEWWNSLTREQQAKVEAAQTAYKAMSDSGAQFNYDTIVSQLRQFIEAGTMYDENGELSIPSLAIEKVTPPADAAEQIASEIGTVEVPANVYLNSHNLGFGIKPFGHGKGAWSIPYDDYPALLHRDEMVLTKSQARKYRDGEFNADYGTIGEMVGMAVESAMNRVYVMMSGEKVGDLTTKRVKKNMNASSYSKLRAMGG